MITVILGVGLKALALIAKLPPLIKLILAATAAGTAVAITSGIDLHDIWFDYVIFVCFSAIITGMPEPDTELRGWQFFYMWAYRTGHLLVASGTAYFMHNRKLDDIVKKEGK